MSNNEPITGVRKPLPSDTKEERQEKLDKPFINKLDVIFNVDYLGSHYEIEIPRLYCWNGADVPRIFWRLIGSPDNPNFLTASMIHDYMVTNRECVNNDRQLSSIIFRELLIGSGVSKIKAYIMYYAVDIYQKLFCNW